MKLLLLLSHSGILSRRKSFDAICAGHVIVNGSVNREPSTDIDESRDRVEYSGKLIQLRKFEYVMMNKPRGYVTTCEGQFDQDVVMALLPRELQHLRPVGRLDKDTEGLLLFMNDGELANRLMHPSFDVEKTYIARVRGRVQPRAVEMLQNGIQIEGELTAPARVRILEAGENETTLEIAIHEGRKHQVRLMCQAVGNHVATLCRVQQGPLSLGALPPAKWRHLTYEEVGAVKAIRPARPGASEDVPEIDRRRLKPLFSTTSEKRRFSTTRTWNNDSDVHAPALPPKYEPAKRPERRDDHRGPKPAGRREDRPYRAREGRPEGRPEHRREESRGPRPEGQRPPYRRDEARGPRPEGARPPYRRDERPAPRREGRPEGERQDRPYRPAVSRPEGRSDYRRDGSRGPRPEGSRPPYRRDESRGPRPEGARSPGRREESRGPRPEGRREERPYQRREESRGPRPEGRSEGAAFSGRRTFSPTSGPAKPPYKSFGVPGKKPYGKKPFGSTGSKPYGSAGKKPYGASSGSKPFGSAGKKPYGPPGKKPFGSRGPKKFGPPSGGRARPPRD